MRWVLLDEVVTIQKGIKAQTRSKIPSCEYSAELLMMEMMAQTGALLVGAESDFQNDLIFAKIDSASFKQPLKKGSLIFIHASSENVRVEGGWMDAWIQNGKEKVAESRFFLMTIGKLISGYEKPITFHDAFMQYFDIRNKISRETFSST